MIHNRINWIDWAKALCIFLMVCGHSRPFPQFHDFLYLFHMPVFFIITGILYKPKNIKKLIISLIIPTLIWNMINYPWYLSGIIGHKPITFENLLSRPILGLIIHDFNIGIPICGAFWFVLVIFILRLIYPIIHKIRIIHIAFIIFCLFTAFKSNQAPENGILFLPQRAIIAYPFFLFGIYIKKHQTILSKINRWEISLLLCSFIILILFSYYLGTFDLYSCNLNYFPLYYCIGIIGFIFIYTLSNKLSSRYGNPSFIQNISNGTLVILGLHIIVFSLLNKLINNTDFPGKGELFSIITMIINHTYYQIYSYLHWKIKGIKTIKIVSYL